MPVQYEIASTINDSIQLNMMWINEKPVKLEVHVDKNLPARLIGDELRIKQIINNLLSNAFKYTDIGRVTLSFGFEKHKDAQTITLVMSVRDTGHGMSKEQLDRLFVEYSRFHQEISSSEGTGLGLTITQSLIRLMNGEIHVESEPNIGTLFTVKLPQKKVDNDVLGEEVAKNLRRFRLNDMNNRKKKQIVREPMPYGRVLFVDDVETNLYVATGLTKPYKLQIDTAMSGYEVISIIKDGKDYDIIFVDHMMPDMDGIELTKRLRDMGYNKPIVALTANAVLGQADMFMQNGFDDFISKPIDIRQLNATLNKFVRDKQPPEVIEEARRQKESEKNDRQPEKPKADPIVMECFSHDVKNAISVLEDLTKKDGWYDNESDLKRFTVTVHGIKSSLLNVGKKTLSESAYTLEKASRSKNTSLIIGATPLFIKELQSLQDRTEADKCNGINGDINGLRIKLLEIARLCAEYNRMGTLNILSELKGYPQETLDEILKIHDLVLNGDFEEAEQAAKAYADTMEKPNAENKPFKISGKQINGLDIAKGLDKYDGDEEIYIKILRSYAASTRSILEKISVVDEENLAKYRIAVHSLKGTSLDIYANEIGNAASKLEEAAVAGNIDYINEHTPAFVKEAYAVINAIDLLLLENLPKTPKPKKDKLDKDVLQQLLEACEIYSIDGVDKAMEEIEKYEYETDGELVEWIIERIRMMDFTDIVAKFTS
jgi:CheY-like chemotaxis protein